MDPGHPLNPIPPNNKLDLQCLLGVGSLRPDIFAGAVVDCMMSVASAFLQVQTMLVGYIAAKAGALMFFVERLKFDGTDQKLGSGSGWGTGELEQPHTCQKHKRVKLTQFDEHV